jgi:hypothetical protein
METYYKFYFNSDLDGADETAAFVIITDGTKYGVAFPDGYDEESVEAMRMAIGARIEAATREESKATPSEVLSFITYNMMFVQASEEDDVYPSWEEASKVAEESLGAFSRGLNNWKFELYEPILPNFSDNDNETEEK